MLAALVAAAWAQTAPETRWTPLLEVRERALSDGAAEVEQRVRLGMEVERLAVSARVSFEDVRAWAVSAGPVTLEGTGPTMSEGWVRVEGHLTRNVGAVATIGRQAVTFHEGRLLGDDPFDASGLRLDAIRLVGRAAPLDVEYVGARRFDGDDPLGRGVDALRVGASHENAVTTWVADGVWIHDETRTTPLTTFGGYGRLDTGRLRTRLEGYLQDRGDGRYGSLTSGAVGWIFGPNERLVVTARWDLLSGADQGAAWRPVLGDTREFGGLLDVYASPAERPDGLSHPSILVEARPAPPLQLSASAHRFAAWDSRAHLGYELDGAVRWSFSPFAALHAAGGWFLADDGDADRLFGYVEVDVSF